MSIFDKMFGRGGAGESYPAHPGESFVVSKGESDGGLVLITVNVAYKAWPGKREYPWLLLVNLPPFNDLLEGRDAFERAIDTALTPVCRYQYYGRALIDGYWESMYYLDKWEEAANALQRLLDSDEFGEFQFLCREDAKWEHAAQFWG